MKTREDIILSMCYTFRHDFGIDIPEGPENFLFTPSGMSENDRKFLWIQMSQIFDNDIKPFMEFK